MTLKISTFTQDITPQAGVLLAGYGPRVKSYAVHDPLLVKGMAFDDGKTRALLLSFDLLGLDRDFVVAIRRTCARSARILEKNVILTCTHTHAGPHTRRLANLKFNKAQQKEFDDYKDFLIARCFLITKNTFQKLREVDLFHYSAQCHENINRRIINPDNSCIYLPTNKHLYPMADNITDPELGILYFVDRETNELLNTVVNYAAHPLTGQSEGYSSHLISADYPGVLRREVEVHLGGKCIFITGACGDLHPRNFECGFSRTEKMGKAIAKMVIDGFADAIGSPEKYQLRNTVLKSKSILFKLPFRKTRCIEGRLPLYEGQDFAWAEVQFLAIGDIVLIGMPGELLSGPGLEIKWNSPFTKSLILYNSTSYLSYMPARNCFVQGGYEAETCHMDEMATFELVVKTVKALQRFAQHD